MKRQICTTLTGAAFASFLLVLPQMTSAAEEAEESAASAQADGAAAPAIEQLSEGKILEDKDNGKVVILEDPTADEITVEQTSIVTPGEDGSVSVRNVLVVNAPSDEVEDVEAAAEEEINASEKGDSTWLSRFFAAIGMGDEVDDGEGNKTDPNAKFRFLYHDKYEGEDGKLLPQTISEEMIVTDREQSRDLATADQIEAVETPVLPPPKDENAVKKAEPFYENILFEEELNGGQGGDEEIAVNIVFNSAPMMDVIPAFADALGFNFVIDTDIRSFVTLNLNSTMTKRDLWAAFATLIENAGVGISVENSGLLRILPLNRLGQRAKLEESEYLLYPLNYASAQEVINQIRPFLGSTATCIQVQRPNAVLLCDYRDNIRKLKDLLEILDDNPRTKWPRVVVPCENILPSKIAEELREVLPTLGFVVKQLNENNEQPGAVKITSIDRLQLIIASAATEEAAKEIRNWIEILDGTISLDQERIFVHKVMYTKSEQLMQALSVLYNMTGTSLTIDDDGSNRTQNVNGTSNTRTNTNNNRNSQYSEYSSTTTDQKSNVFETPVKIFSDGALNRLVIRTTPRTYASIKALLDRLDVVPAQVLLQVTVAEVTLTDEMQFGLELAAASSWGGNMMSMSTKWSDLSPDIDQSGINSRQTGYSFMLADPNDPNNKLGYLRAYAGDNKFKVVASPQVLVSSNTEATINVGEQTPYVGSTVTDTSSSGSLLTSTSYKDSGIKLVVTPQVTSTDLISLKINQSLSSASMMQVSDTTSAPKLSTREVQTYMTIHNGQTMIIGGLIQETGTDILQSLPILNEIPFLRRLFGNTDSELARTEILIMITGHIINEKSRVEDMIRRYNDALEAINDFEDNLGSSTDGKHKKASSRMFTLDY
jgi:type II secretion system protein D